NSLRKTANIFYIKYPNKAKLSPMTIKNLVNKFTKSGNIADDYHSGHPLSATNHTKQEATINALQENPQQSTNQLAMKLNVSSSSI
ncbi:27309_t:CDS:1, partial [Dentiscutata erythropus]